MSKNRYEIIDHLKAIAVILMVIYHLAYDLYVLRVLDFNMGQSNFWYVQPKIIIFLFLFSMGMNLCVVYKKGVDTKKLTKRFLKLLTVSIVLSVVTYIYYPSKWIYFGVIHHIAFASVVGIYFLKKPRLSLILGIIVLFPSVFLSYDYPFYKPNPFPLDYVPPLPWFGCVLLGIYAYSKGLHRLKVPKHRFKSLFKFLGKHSLFIYLTHQLILYPLIYLIKKYLL